jgi:hypothetical protein
MPLVSVGVPEHKETRTGVSVSAFINIGSERKEIYFRLPISVAANKGDAFLAATLLPAMKQTGTLRIEGHVSLDILKNIPKIQQIFHRWDPTLEYIPVETSPCENSAPTNGGRIGCFFSGGIDSFYTLLKHTPEITDLIFVHGFDIPLSNTPLRGKVSESLRAIAKGLEKSLIEIETNLREFSDCYVSWNFVHGAALASVGLMLSPLFSRIYIAASCSYADLFPWGSHPLVDPLWSTGATEIVHDGCEATRVEKAAYIASNELAIKHLRVCWENPEGAYNCGRCEKCIRTMAILRAVGVTSSPSFGRPLNLRSLANRQVKEIHRAHLQGALEAAERSGKDLELARALRCCLSGRRHRGLQGLARRVIRRLGN